MPQPIITLTTDFGEDSPYVAAMKGVILGINPQVRIVDLSHQVPPQDVRYAAFFLTSAIPYFPPEVLHVVVVDPGVGSERAILYVETDGHRLLVPDNGCWTELPASKPPPVRRLSERGFWREPVSATFHGRDIFAPVAARLSLGLDPARLGPAVTDWVRLPTRAPELGTDSLAGEVVFVDHFGNLITNIPGAAFLALAARPLRITIEGQPVPRHVRTYAEVDPGAVVALVGSTERLEIAVSQGSAARQLRLGVGSRVVVTAENPSARY
jgi:S-adenosylmethionine hydrolase